MEKDQIEFSEQMKKANNEVEEVGERRTSVLGYFLLAIMVVFLIVIGQTVFSDLGDIPQKPKYPSSCTTYLNFNDSKKLIGDNYYAYSSVGSLAELSYFPTSCDFSAIDRQLGLDVEIGGVESQIRQIIKLNEQIRILKNKVNSSEDQIDRLGSRYDISLQEKMAGEQKPVMSGEILQGDIVGQQTTIVNTQAEIQTLENQKDQLVAKLTPVVNKFQEKIDQAIAAYGRALAWYKFKIFLLKLIFVLPFFGFAVFYYLRLKKKNSPYTIIFTAVAVAASLLFLEIILVLLYDIIPREFLARIFEIFMSTPILRYILYYGSVLLVLGIFGGIVYYIQKRVYNPKNVAMRRLRDNKCPNCSFIINMHYNNCPKCGRQFKEPCAHCGNLRLSDLPYCPICGK